MTGLLGFGRDTLQAASNAVADGFLSGPVDLINSGLLAVGVPMPAKPFGGSEWVRERGLTREVADPYAKALGETLGLVGPMVATAKAPQIAHGLLQMADNAAAPTPINTGTRRQAGIFAGVGARNADTAALTRAEALEKQGVAPEAIYKETGWFKAPWDKKWRFEIDDSGAIPKGLLSPGEAADFKADGYTLVRRQQALAHPKLSAAYPDSKNIGVRVDRNLGDQGAYTPGMDYIEAGAGANGKTNRSTMLHELQHAVQHREGFARGGNPGMFDNNYADLVRRLYRSQDDYMRAKSAGGVDPETGLSAKTIEQNMSTLESQVRRWVSPEESYRRLAGEAEARAVQARMNMTPAERAASFPLSSFDVPLDQLIVR